MPPFIFNEVNKLTNSIDHTLVFKEDLIESARETLLSIQKQHNKKRDKLLKQKTLKKSKEKSKTATAGANVISKKEKRKVSKSSKKRINTVFVGIHSRY